jgi:hypothetical protein
MMGNVKITEKSLSRLYLLLLHLRGETDLDEETYNTIVHELYWMIQDKIEASKRRTEYMNAKKE